MERDDYNLSRRVGALQISIIIIINSDNCFGQFFRVNGTAKPIFDDVVVDIETCTEREREREREREHIFDEVGFAAVA